MSRRFALATVERIRAQRVEQRVQNLSRADRALTAARLRCRDLRQELAGCSTAAATTSDQANLLDRRAWFLREALQVADQELAAADHGRRAAQDAWSRARAEHEAVITLHRNHDERWRLEDQRREQKMVDDLAGARPGGAR